jgi:hypothetical protein
MRLHETWVDQVINSRENAGADTRILPATIDPGQTTRARPDFNGHLHTQAFFRQCDEVRNCAFKRTLNVSAPLQGQALNGAPDRPIWSPRMTRI